MMTAIARQTLPMQFTLEGVTASAGVPMILDGPQLAASEQGVIDMALRNSAGLSGIIISAFGDPGIDTLRGLTDCPVVGICEASMLEASDGKRRFGIATVTPDLVASFAAKAEALGVASAFTGTRLTEGDPEALTSDPQALEDALFNAARRCFEDDGAEAVIIGGGPLGQAALALANRFYGPVIAPIPSAVALLVARIAARVPHGSGPGGWPPATAVL